MDNRNTTKNLVAELNSKIKIYHTPQLIEWGDLQDMTRGFGGTGIDGALGSNFQPLGPQPVDPNNPWPLPLPPETDH